MIEAVDKRPEVEKTPRLVEVIQVAEARDVSDPVSILFMPNIKGITQPSQTVLDLFTTAGDVYRVETLAYGKADAKTYAKHIKEAFERKTGFVSSPNRVVIGYSSSCPIAAETGTMLGLPKKNIILVAPVWPLKQPFLRQRTQAAVERIKRERIGQQAAEEGKINWEYVRACLPLLLSREPIENIRRLIQFGVINPEQAAAGTIFSGEKDEMISPKQKFTDIVVPEAGHGFEEFAPAITKYLIDSKTK